MRYRMNQKTFCMGDDFSIEDEAGNVAFNVDGKAFSIGDKLSFQDASGTEVAYIAQKVLSLKPTYEIYRDGTVFARVTKDWTLFKDKFSVDVPGPNDYTINGNFLDHEYRFERSGRTVASISKEYFSWADSYGIDVVDGEDDVTILATAVVIDLVCHDGDK